MAVETGRGGCDVDITHLSGTAPVTLSDLSSGHIRVSSSHRVPFNYLKVHTHLGQNAMLPLSLEKTVHISSQLQLFIGMFRNKVLNVH